MESPRAPQLPGSEPPRRCVIAVVCRHEQFLVIRRSQFVAAPGMLCFPGGHMEPGESERDAIRREMQEEIGIPAEPRVRLWESTIGARVVLYWWLTEIELSRPMAPNPQEVESIHWMQVDALALHPELLPSNREFLEALQSNKVFFDRRSWRH